MDEKSFERIEGEAALALRNPIHAVIEQYNDAITRLPEPGLPLALALRDPVSGAVSGGLWAISYYGWLFVELLVLPEAVRGQGLGTRLMREAERVARERGCVGVWLDTFTFQARGFYEKLGYTVFGQIDDYPPGHSRFWLQKRLDRSGPG
jgi:GNAT superfamily N-acetyltransferase